MEEKNIMSYETVLPENFDGTFRFTNDSDEDFTAKWASKEYVFPKRSTSPMPAHSLNATPLEVQQIRKKFALDWAVREFYKSGSYENYLKQERNNDGSPRLNSIHQAGSYSIDQLAPFIQRCLKPLESGKVEISEPMITPKTLLEEKLSRDDEGELNTIAVKKDDDLVEQKKAFKKKAKIS